MASYNTSGITSGDPRNLGGSEGYGPSRSSRPKARSSSSSTSSFGGGSTYSGSGSSVSGGRGNIVERPGERAAALAAQNSNRDNSGNRNNNIATSFISAGAILPAPPPPKASTYRERTGKSLYDKDIFKESFINIPDNTSDITNFLNRSAVDDALRDALGMPDLPEIYTGQMGKEEPETRIDMSVLQGALQPEPITVEELPDVITKAGDTLTAIAASVDLPLQAVIDANPQIKNPDLIRPGERITIPSILSAAGELLKTATDPQAPAPVSEDPDRKFYQSGVDIEDRMFEGEDPRNLGGAEGYGSVGTPPEADAGEGLMSDLRKLGGAEGYGNPVGDLSIFSKPVDNMYTEFKEIEGEEAHLGGADYKEVGITLPLGIVATSGLKYTHKGKTIDLPKDKAKRWGVLSKAGVTTSNFDPSNVITDDAVKDGIKRSDYLNDENWTKAVIKSFEKSAVAEIEAEGVDTSKLDDKVIEGIASLAWNAQGHKWKDIEAAYPELVKTNPDMSKVQTGMLQVFTANKIIIRGLADRRAKDYNKVAEGLDQPTITAYTPKKLTNGNAGIEYKLSDGTSITRDTGKDYATQASKASFKDYLDTEIAI